VRGNKRDYDFWAVDNPGWSYDEVLPYFIKLEDNRNPYYIAVNNTKYHGTGGGGFITVQERSRIAVYNATCDHIC
jgi:choline dehydrogenase-like flavoprotein